MELTRRYKHKYKYLYWHLFEKLCCLSCPLLLFLFQLKLGSYFVTIGTPLGVHNRSTEGLNSSVERRLQMEDCVDRGQFWFVCPPRPIIKYLYLYKSRQWPQIFLQVLHPLDPF